MTQRRASSLNRFARRVRYALANPGAVMRHVTGTTQSPQPSDPLAPLATYLERGYAVGLDRPVLFLSFDCDTDLDFDAARDVKRFLDKLGIKATWAVPGVQIERGAETYRAIASSGDEFMNHGQLPHTDWHGDRYVSITWYHEMTPAEVERDIEAGDDTIRRVLGVTPQGFRAPHFGLFSAPDQLALIHRTAQRLGYSYCSTTLPQYGIDNGPLVDVGSLVELPTFGSLAAPTSVLDSWTYLTDRANYALGEVYADLMHETVERVVAERAPVMLTWYADPSHVAGQAPFERAMQHLVDSGVSSLYGRDAAALSRRTAGTA